MDYGEILGSAWKIIWKHKVLWIFGFFASLLANGGSGSSSGSSSVNSPNIGSSSNTTGWFNNTGLSYQIEQFIDSGAFWAIIATFIFALICLFFIIFVISLILGTFGKIGLVHGAWLADQGQEKLSFGQLWRDSKPYFWRVFLLNILRWLLGIILTLVLIIPVILVIIFTLGCGLCLLIPVLIVLSWFITVFYEQSLVAVVGEDLGITDAIKRGWQIVTKNLISMALMAVILFVGSAIVSLLIGLPVLFIVLPILGGFLLGENIAIGIGIFISIAILFVYIPIAIILSSGLQAYLGTTWTLVFRRITESVSV